MPTSTTYTIDSDYVAPESINIAHRMVGTITLIITSLTFWIGSVVALLCMYNFWIALLIWLCMSLIAKGAAYFAGLNDDSVNRAADAVGSVVCGTYSRVRGLFSK